MEDIFSLKRHQFKSSSNIILFIFTCFCMISLFILEGRIGINLNDEAFVWYGSSAILHGQVPTRDFYAYDPGRYYLTALIMWLMGDEGIVVSRVAEILVQGLGLFLALSMLSPLLKFPARIFNLFYIFLISLILLLWMIPLYKSFDITASIVLIAILTHLIETPTLKACFLAGVGVSCIAIIGRNHGIYGAVASIACLMYLKLTLQYYSLIAALKYWFVGLCVGYIPIILMLVFIPDFSSAFFEGIYFLIINKSTNLYIPIPWPWRAANLENFVTGIFFVAIFLFAICSLSYIVIAKFKNKKLPSVCIACAFLSLPYAHYAFSRADAIHLALGGYPFLIGLLAYLYHSKFNPLIWFAQILLFVFSTILMWHLHPALQSYNDKQWQYANITGSNIKVDPNVFNDLEMFKRLINQYANDGQSFLVMPFNFGMYAIFNRKSPMWDLYPLFVRSEEEQIADIKRIKKAQPRFVVIYDFALDGDPNRQFHHTHSTIFKYIADNFELIHDIGETPNVYIYKARL